jgi:hypothetical protein
MLIANIAYIGNYAYKFILKLSLKSECTKLFKMIVGCYKIYQFTLWNFFYNISDVGKWYCSWIVFCLCINVHCEFMVDSADRCGSNVRLWQSVNVLLMC